MTATKTESYKPLAFPDAKSFADIFRDAKPYTLGGKGARIIAVLPSWEAGTWSDRARKTTFTVSGAVYVNRRDPEKRVNLDCDLAPEVLEFIKSDMLHTSNDRLYFEVIEQSDGRALVVAQYNAISGNRWLAMIDGDTIPTK